MLPSVGRGIMSTRAGSASSAAFASAVNSSLAEFSVMRKPWTEYLSQLPKQDSEPLATPMNPKPMYRGRREGRAGWLFGEQVQLHYRRYPDEGLLVNVNRWRYGDTLNDIELQQFKNAQPHILDREDEQGFQTPAPELYLKLNYKNPAVLSRFLTRTGHYYPQDVLPLNPEATKMHRVELVRAKRIGLYPKHGNPFWFRVQQFRPKASESLYDPVQSSVKSTTEHFCFNWLQLHRIKTYFEQAGSTVGTGAQMAKGKHERELAAHGIAPSYPSTVAPSGKSLAKQQSEPTGTASAFGSKNRTVVHAVTPANATAGPKVTTVAGLMSTKGLRRNLNLYSRSSKKRMGFPNPLGTTLKI